MVGASTPLRVLTSPLPGDGAREGFGAALSTTFLRTVLLGLAHCTYGAVTGLGFGVAAERRRPIVTALAPAAQKQVGPPALSSTPSQQELDYYARVIEAFDAAVKQGHASTTVDGKMIDVAMANAARRTLDQAAAWKKAG